MPPTTKTDANQSFFISVRDTNTNQIKRIAIPSDVQVGLFDNPAFLVLLGGFAIATKSLIVDGATNSKINVGNHDTVVSVTRKTAPSSNQIAVYLPSTPVEGQLHVIKDASGTAGSTPISIISPSGVEIDGESTQTIDFAYGSLMLFWSLDSWHVMVAATGSGSGSGADIAASYIVVANTSSLPNERALAVGPGLSLTDGGAGAALTISLSPVPDTGASYITIANTSSLSNERSLAVSSDLKLTDGGANASVTVGLSDLNSFKMTQIPDVSSSYVVVGVTGSLPNERAITAGTNITITDNGPGGTLVINAQGGGGATTDWTTIYEIDFQAQTSASYTGSLPVIINGVTWTIDNFGRADSIGILPGRGLIIDPNGTSSDYFSSTRTAPLIRTPVISLFPAYDPALYQVKLDVQLQMTGMSNLYEFGKIAIEKTKNTTSLGQVHMAIGKQWTDYAGTPQSGLPVTGTISTTITQDNATNIVSQESNSFHDVMTIIYKDGTFIEFRSSIFGATTWATTEQVRNVGVMRTSVAQTSLNSLITSSAEPSVVLVCGTAGDTTNTLSTTYKRLRLQYRGR